MNSEALIGGVAVTLRESARARRMRLGVDPRSGAVTLTIPRRASRRRALAWAAEQHEWIAARLAALPRAAPIAPGATIPFRGIERRIEWSPDRARRVTLDGERLLVGGPIEGLGTRALRWLKAEARALLAAETHELAVLAGVAAARIGVGDPVSRWGSCSSSGAIRYSWRLILAPDFVRRATVAHEVAHLVHLNHGPDFHALVARLFGEDPRPARAWLRRHGAGLHRIGRPVRR
ncbi:M48 family metallopeptidase [Sphingosinicella sp.]|uniref:M48 family metallopeptidase n=1 Tax=Sphingosinicella sp. TaxID=1917971 RepID=UPI0040383B52